MSPVSFSQMAQQRQSCRNFAVKSVEKEKLLHCIEVARFSPSARNIQPWHFTVVTKKELCPKLAKLLQAGGFNFFTDNCPAFIVICETADDPAMIGHQTFAPLDIGLTAAHICYAAMEQGLATCLLGYLDTEAEIKALLQIPQAYKLRLTIAVGYAAEGDPLREKSRKLIEEIADFCLD